MKSIVAMSLVMFVVGCSTNPKYVEGTNLSIGAYVPVSGQLYGAEVCNYLSGCKAQCTSNQTMHVERVFNSTNSYFWGMVNTVEGSNTKVDIK